MRHVPLTLVILAAASAPACLPGGRLPPETPRRGGTLDTRQPVATADAGPFRVVFAGPSADDLEHPQPEIVFSRPVRALSAPPGEPALSARFSPAVAGRWEWTGTRAARFVPDGDFDRATRYTLEIAATVRALDGAALDAPVRLEFSTKRPSLMSSWPASGELEVPTTEPVRLTFDQTLPRPALAAALSVVDSAGRDVPFVLERDGDAWDESVQVRPRGKWPEGERLTVRLRGGVTGSEGTLTTLPREVTFSTRSHLHVTEISCSRLDDGRCSGDSVSVQLSDDIRPSDLRALVSVRPPVKLARDTDDVPTSYHWLRGEFRPGVRYEISVAPAARPPRQPRPRRPGEAVAELRRLRIGGSAELTFAPEETGAELSFHGTYTPSRRLPIAAKAADAREAAAGALAMTRELAVTLAGSRDEIRWWELPGASRTSVPVRADEKARPTWTELASASAAARGPVLFGTLWRGPSGDERSTARVLQASDLALHARVSPEGTLAWITSLTTGAPLAGVEVEARDASGAIVKAVTAADGVARLDTSRLGTPVARRPDDWRAPSPWMVLVASRDTDWVYRRVEVPRAEPPRGLLFTDRGLYRPGEEVRLKGALLRPTSRGLDPVALAQATVEVRAPGGKVTRSPARTTEWGSLDHVVAIDPDAPLGTWTAALELDGARVVSESFRVKQARPASFRVEATLRDPARPERRAFVRGDAVSCEARAGYFYGGSLGDARASLSLDRQRATYAVPGLSGFSIDDVERQIVGGARAERQARLDAGGRIEATFALDHDQTGPELVTCGALVTDANEELVGASASAIVHPASLYAALALERGSTFGGETLRPRVLAVTPDGARVAHAVKLELVAHEKDPKKTWSTLPPRVVASCDASPAAEPASCALGVPAGALEDVRRFVVRATVETREGRAVASRTLYPSAPPREAPAVRQPRKVTRQAKLERDRDEYGRGETAHLTATSPFDAGHLLFTVERDGVLSHEVRATTAAPLSLDAPIDDAAAPQLFATATFVAPLSDRATTRHVMSATTELRAAWQDRALEVSVRPSRALAAPGEELDVEVEVRQADGRPARAEVTLYAADEGTLSLAKYTLPQPLPSLYAARRRSISSVDSRDDLAHLIDWEGELRDFGRGVGLGSIGTIGHGAGTGSGQGYGGGGGRLGVAGAEPRRNFAQGAFFLPHLETDDRGRASARVKLPDSLTEYRVMAFALTRRAEVGAGQAAVTTQAPLQIRPTLPAVLRAGDRPTVTMLVANNGPARLDADVSVDATGLLLSSDRARRVSLAPGESRRVTVAAEAHSVMKGKLVARVAAGSLSDAAELPLEIIAPLSQETAGSSGSLDHGRVDELLGDLTGMRPDVGGLEVSVSSTPLSGLAAGLEQLVTYPHGCTEQTTSRLVPLLPLRELARSLDVALPADLDAAVAGAVTRLQASERGDGSFGMWPGSGAASDWLSAYATWGLELARRHGAPVDPVLLGRARGRLLSTLARWGELPDARVDAPYALDVLTDALGQDGVDADSLAVVAEQLYRARAGTPVFSRALLLHAMARLGAPRAELDALVAELTSGLHLDGPVARHVGRDGEHQGRFDSETRTSALVLRALVAAAPRHPLVVPLALGLVRDRRAGTWRTTQEAAWALLALDDLRRERGDAATVAATVTLGGTTILSRALAPGATDAEARVPMAEVARALGPLGFAASGGTLHYEARLRFARRELPTDDLASGLELHRRYTQVSEKAPSSGARAVLREDATTFAEGATVLVQLEIVTSSPRRFVVIEDPLPGGLESWDLDLSGGPRWLRRLERAPATRTERRGDRIVFFVDELRPGVHRFSHLVRATRAGTYVTPPARAEEMYAPETYGRTAARTVVVR